MKRDAAICPNCHGDLKTNCSTCGQIVMVGQITCPSCHSSLKAPIAQLLKGGKN
jgi:RNA polymerase subunit RPABC4/transcription elongation factor Spt4